MKQTSILFFPWSFQSCKGRAFEYLAFGTMASLRVLRELRVYEGSIPVLHGFQDFGSKFGHSILGFQGFVFVRILFVFCEFVSGSL